MIFTSRIVMIALAIAAATLVIVIRTSAVASNEANLAIAQLALVRQQIRSIGELNAQTPDWTRRGRPSLGQGGLAALVNDALSTAGIPASALASLSPAAETPVGPGGQSGSGTVAAFRRRAVLTLAPVTLPQVGAIIDAWRQTQPDWILSSIDLTPEAQGRREPPPGSDLPLRATLSLETLYIDLPSVHAASGGRP